MTCSMMKTLYLSKSLKIPLAHHNLALLLEGIINLKKYITLPFSNYSSLVRRDIRVRDRLLELERATTSIL